MPNLNASTVYRKRNKERCRTKTESWTNGPGKGPGLPTGRMFLAMRNSSHTQDALSASLYDVSVTSRPPLVPAAASEASAEKAASAASMPASTQGGTFHRSVISIYIQRYRIYAGGRCLKAQSSDKHFFLQRVASSFSSTWTLIRSLMQIHILRKCLICGLICQHQALSPDRHTLR